QLRERDLQADREQQKYHAELGEQVHARAVLNGQIADPGIVRDQQPEPKGTHHQTGDEEAKNGADAGVMEQRNDEAGDDEEAEDVLEQRCVFQLPPLPMSAHNRMLQLPPSAISMASSAAAAFEPSGPPACAMSGRPPPPLPPRASAPLRTRSTALKRDTRSSVTPTTRPPWPSGAVLPPATTPEPTLILPSSASDFSSLLARPLTARRKNLVPLMSTMFEP